jgi:hypothetical protein
MPSPQEYAAQRLAQNSETVRPYPRTADTEGNTSGQAELPKQASAMHASSGPGPKTAQGRARSIMNALRHGLTARVVVLPTKDMAAYQQFCKEIVDSLDAQTPVELQFAQTIADNQWRINRLRSIEDGMLAQGHFESAGDFDADNTEIHGAMTAARSFMRAPKSSVRNAAAIASTTPESPKRPASTSPNMKKWPPECAKRGLRANFAVLAKLRACPPFLPTGIEYGTDIRSLSPQSTC